MFFRVGGAACFSIPAAIDTPVRTHDFPWDTFHFTSIAAIIVHTVIPTIVPAI